MGALVKCRGRLFIQIPQETPHSDGIMENARMLSVNSPSSIREEVWGGGATLFPERSSWRHRRNVGRVETAGMTQGMASDKSELGYSSMHD